MRDMIYEAHHKFPKGLKKELALVFGMDKPRCVVCWSCNAIAIHHYGHTDFCTHAYQRDENNNPNYTNLSNFVLLCGSCHSKFHSIRNVISSYQGQEPPFMLLIRHIMERTFPELKKKREEKEAGCIITEEKPLGILPEFV